MLLFCACYVPVLGFDWLLRCASVLLCSCVILLGCICVSCVIVLCSVAVLCCARALAVRRYRPVSLLYCVSLHCLFDAMLLSGVGVLCTLRSYRTLCCLALRLRFLCYCAVFCCCTVLRSRQCLFDRMLVCGVAVLCLLRTCAVLRLVTALCFCVLMFLRYTPALRLRFLRYHSVLCCCVVLCSHSCCAVLLCSAVLTICLVLVFGCSVSSMLCCNPVLLFCCLPALCCL